MKKLMTTVRSLALIAFVTSIIWNAGITECVAGIVTAESLQSAVTDSLHAIAGREGIRVEAAVHALSDITIPFSGQPVISVAIPSLGSFKSMIRAKISMLNDSGALLHSVAVGVRMKYYELAVLAANDFKRGDRLDRDSMIIEEVEVTGKRDFYTSLDGLDMMQAKRSMKAETLILRKFTEPVPLVTRGDRVTVKARVGNVEILAQGTARESGGLNDCIRVYTTTTKKTLNCMIIDEKTVLAGGKGG